jgi:hypothetical protein
MDSVDAAACHGCWTLELPAIAAAGFLVGRSWDSQGYCEPSSRH